MDRRSFTLRSNFPTAMSRLFGNRAKAAKYAGLWTAGVGLGWRQGRLSVCQWGRGTRAAVTQRAQVKCVVIDKPSGARLRNQASVTEQDVRKRLCAICPYSSRIITGSASKAEKVPNFIKPTFSKKGIGEFSNKLHFWNQQGVSFRVVCFVCFEPSDPFQRTMLQPTKMSIL